MQGPITIGRQVGLLARLWRTELDNRLRPLGLSQARWLLLVHLSDAGEGLAQLDLAVRAGVTGPTLVRQIDQLEQAGLVERKEDSSDRRIKRVLLTPRGQATFAEVDEIARALRREILEGEDPADVEATLRLTQRLIRRLETLARSPVEGAA